MPLITSANIACGGHAGDRDTMRAAIELALRHGVAIGAHPGIADPGQFGRVERPVSEGEAASLISDQVGLLQELAAGAGARVEHVKPHGALYNMASRDSRLSTAIAEAVFSRDPALILVGLAGSRLLEAGRRRGLRVASEIFADRTYRADGTLTPRTEAGALVADPEAGAAQVERILRTGFARAADGNEFAASADTVCVHGDGPHAVQSLRVLRQRLAEAGVRAVRLAALLPRAQGA